MATGRRSGDGEGCSEGTRWQWPWLSSAVAPQSPSKEVGTGESDWPALVTREDFCQVSSTPLQPEWLFRYHKKREE